MTFLRALIAGSSTGIFTFLLCFLLFDSQSQRLMFSTIAAVATFGSWILGEFSEQSELHENLTFGGIFVLFFFMSLIVEIVKNICM